MCAEVDELRSYWNNRDDGDAQYAEFVKQRKQLTKATKQVRFELCVLERPC